MGITINGRLDHKSGFVGLVMAVTGILYYHTLMEAKKICIGIIGGSGLGDALGAETGEPIDVETPFGKPSADIIKLEWAGLEIYVLQRHGEGHTLNPTEVPYRANIFAMKKLGVTHLIASGATGSLREEIRPGDLVIVDQVIDKTYRRANTFYEGAAVHVEMSDPFCEVMREWLLDASKQLLGKEIAVHERGTYITMEGPSFSTKAESHMHRSWGGDLIGMTCMPEAKLAKEAEIAYALIGLPTDYDCWKPHEGEGLELLQEIIGNLKKASAAGIALIKKALENISVLEQNPSRSHTALALGIWSDKSKISPEYIKRLEVLWGKYFE